MRGARSVRMRAGAARATREIALTLQNEGQYGPRVRDGAETAIRSVNPAVVVALPTRARPAARPDTGTTSVRRNVASRRDASAALLAALADLGGEHQIGTRSLQRFASKAARAVGADVLTVRLIDGQARRLALAASVGMPKTLRLELHRLMVDAGLGLASMRERVEHLHGEMHLRSSPGRGCRLSVSCPIEVKRARTAR